MAETHKGPRRRIVVLGGGFGGLAFARHFQPRADTEVVLVDRQNHHLFQPLLYQVATAGLAAPSISAPIRRILSGKPYVNVMLDEARSVDVARRTIHLREGTLDYDYLVLAVGAKTSYFGNDHWEPYAPGLKTLDDAMRIRRNLLLAFEKAEMEENSHALRRLTTVLIIGGGPTGVEMAGTIAELARRVLRKDFRHVDLNRTRVLLVQAGDRLLPAFAEECSVAARAQLEGLGVQVITGRMVQDIGPQTATLDDGRIIEAANIIWTAGVAPHPITQTLGAETDKAGRVKVGVDGAVPGHPEIFVVGDCAHWVDAKGKPVPGVSPGAMQTGEHVAKLLRRELKAVSADREVPAREPFTYWDKGSMATIGRSAAVAQVGKTRFQGLFAWLLWLLVHLLFLVSFRNKLIVLIGWFFNYVQFRPGARIITGMDRVYRRLDRAHKEKGAPLRDTPGGEAVRQTR